MKLALAGVRPGCHPVLKITEELRKAVENVHRLIKEGTFPF